VLARVGRFDEADRVLDAVLARDPDNHGARLRRFEVAAMRGVPAEVAQRGDAIVDHPAATGADLNAVAWVRLGLGGDLAPVLELSRKAVERTPSSANAVNTVAAIEAEVGELGRAVEDNWKAMQLSGAREPGDGDWYVVGRIDEQLGLTADAAAAYKRVKPRPDQALSVYALAQRRLAALHAAH
jgi:tetratricopeptide (TPR) repeat protein